MSDVTPPPPPSSSSASSTSPRDPTRDPPASASLPDVEPRPRAVTIRSVLIGLAGVILICGLTPYNDYAVANTFAVGNFLPISLVLILLVLVLLVNGPLRRLAPGLAIREAELAVIAAMMLAACSLPSSGLMRYLPTGIVGMFHGATERADFAKVLTEAQVPRWLLPDLPDAATQPAEIGSTDVVKQFRTRSPDGVIPWGAWVKPFLTWGIFVALLWGSMLLICLLVRRQWVENERLSFPLATVYGALIEQPEPGRALNAMFRSYGFWIAAGAVFALHAFNGLHEYFPRVPAIPRGYDFTAIFADPPLEYTRWFFKTSEIFFCVVGITFFLQTKVAFSIWFFYVLLNFVGVVLTGTFQYQIPDQARMDQTFGGLLVMCGVIFWIGRSHWWMIGRHMFANPRPGESESRYLPYGFAGWMLTACVIGLVIWFMAMGAAWYGAIATTLALLMMLMMTARILAETGLVFVQINWQMSRMWLYPALIPEEPIKTDPRTFFVTAWMTNLFHDLRESFAAFFLTGVRVADASAYERSRRWRTGFSFVLAIVLALFVGYWVSAASMIWTEYTYDSTMGARPESPINAYGIQGSPYSHVLEASNAYAGTRAEPHNQAIHVGIGGAIVGLCSVLRLTLSWWPLHPIGFIVLHSYATEKIWFSIMIGWIAKVVVVRFGGASLLKAGRNVFIGLVVGEAAAAAAWLVISLVLNWMGMEYHRIILLPG
jgi:hypothetical protein